MVVYTYGVFDLLHYGHMEAIKELLLISPNLVVGIFTDKVVTKFKRKPVMTFNERFRFMEILGERMGFKVVKQDRLDPDKNVKELMKKYINVYVAKGKGAGFENYNRPNYILMPYHEGISTSEIIERIKKCK